MSQSITDGAGRLNIEWSQATFDVSFAFDSGLPLTGTFEFVVENMQTGTDAATATCTITEAGVPSATDGVVRVEIPAVTMKALSGRYRYSLRHIVGAVETVEVRGEFKVDRTAL